MTNSTFIDYDKFGKDNFKRALINRQFYKTISESITKKKDGSVIILEVPPENYLEANITSIKSLLNNNFEGTYISFQRPFNNICSLFKENDINLNKVLVVDAASSLCGEIQEYNNRCIGLTDKVKINEIAKVVYLSLLRLESENKFVFVDSLSTFALYENLSDSLKFPKFLINKIRQNHLENVVFIFNIANDVYNKRYVDNMSSYADRCLHLGLCI